MFSRINKTVNDRRNGIKNEEGFTLIELLVVVLIIGILAAIAIPVFLGVQDNAKKSAITSDLTNAKTAIIAYFTNDPDADAPDLETDLGTWGYTPSDDVDLVFVGLPPTGPGVDFCIEGEHGDLEDVPANKKHITPEGGVEEGVCGATS